MRIFASNWLSFPSDNERNDLFFDLCLADLEIEKEDTCTVIASL